MARARTVLTPKAAPRTKAAAPASVDGWMPPAGRAWRCRPLPTGRIFYADDLATVTAHAESLLFDGTESMIEHAIRGGYAPYHEGSVVTVEQLARQGLAHETVATRRRPDGTMSSDTRWSITPAGWELLEQVRR